VYASGNRRDRFNPKRGRLTGRPFRFVTTAALAANNVDGRHTFATMPSQFIGRSWRENDLHACALLRTRENFAMSKIVPVGVSFRQSLISAWFAVVVSLAVLGLLSSEAKALCVSQPISGQWVNMDPQARDLTRANIIFNCNDVIARPADGPPPPRPPAFEAEIWGSCSPADCPWGRVAASPLPAGAAVVATLRASYDHGFASRTVTMNLRGETLYISVWTDFRDPGRRDYRMRLSMRRA
jgi:hypothetical protein